MVGDGGPGPMPAGGTISPLRCDGGRRVRVQLTAAAVTKRRGAGPNGTVMTWRWRSDLGHAAAEGTGETTELRRAGKGC